MSELMNGTIKAIVGLGRKSSRINTYTLQQKRAQQILTTCLCSLSVLLAIITLYLISKAHQHFRHTLILILIISQLCKVVWLGVYSSFQLSRTIPPQIPGISPRPPHTSNFCFADGWFVTFGTDGADFVAFLIALHTILTIFKPGRHLDKGGLYPYRIVIYIAWIIYPAIMASLAFVNGKMAYLDQGSFCTLPVRPFWYRLALSWVPRYLILMFILTVYASVYLYASYKFDALDLNIRSTSESANQSTFGAPSTNGTANTISDSINVDRCIESSPLSWRHRAIKRQLRYMFIYPVVYLLLWILPFVSHCYGYTKTQPPFGVSTAAIVSSTLQCAADCVVFLVRERPWRHVDTSWKPSRRVTKVSWKSTKAGATVISRERMKEKPSGRTRDWWDVEISIIDRRDENEEWPLPPLPA